jgi:hypothetical protein
MVPAKRMLRNMAQRIAKVFYEGPEPPKRIAVAVAEFVRASPHATQQEWSAFALHFAQECYRTGYVRGLEWSERDIERRDPAVDPEAFVEAAQNDMSFERDENDPPPITDVDAVVDGDVPGGGDVKQ